MINEDRRALPEEGLESEREREGVLEEFHLNKYPR